LNGAKRQVSTISVIFMTRNKFTNNRLCK